MDVSRILERTSSTRSGGAADTASSEDNAKPRTMLASAAAGAARA
jgi:hypothetical protein